MSQQNFTQGIEKVFEEYSSTTAVAVVTKSPFTICIVFHCGIFLYLTVTVILFLAMAATAHCLLCRVYTAVPQMLVPT